MFEFISCNLELVIGGIVAAVEAVVRVTETKKDDQFAKGIILPVLRAIAMAKKK